MSLYAIKDKDGELRDAAGASPDEVGGFLTWTKHSNADMLRQIEYSNGHVVELVEKAEPVEESKEVASYLAGLKAEITVGSTGHYANYYVRNLRIIHDMSIEDIFRALDVGWTVKQPKRWYVRAPKEWDGCKGGRQRFFKSDNDVICTIVESLADNTADEQFTAEEIDKYHLGGFETVEVED